MSPGQQGTPGVAVPIPHTPALQRGRQLLVRSNKRRDHDRRNRTEANAAVARVRQSARANKGMLETAGDATYCFISTVLSVEKRSCSDLEF